MISTTRHNSNVTIKYNSLQERLLVVLGLLEQRLAAHVAPHDQLAVGAAGHVALLIARAAQRPRLVVVLVERVDALVVADAPQLDEAVGRRRDELRRVVHERHLEHRRAVALESLQFLRLKLFMCLFN